MEWNQVAFHLISLFSFLINLKNMNKINSVFINLLIILSLSKQLIKTLLHLNIKYPNNGIYCSFILFSFNHNNGIVTSTLKLYLYQFQKKIYIKW